MDTEKRASYQALAYTFKDIYMTRWNLSLSDFSNKVYATLASAVLDGIIKEEALDLIIEQTWTRDVTIPIPDNLKERHGIIARTIYRRITTGGYGSVKAIFSSYETESNNKEKELVEISLLVKRMLTQDFADGKRSLDETGELHNILTLATIRGIAIQKRFRALLTITEKCLEQLEV